MLNDMGRNDDIEWLDLSGKVIECVSQSGDPRNRLLDVINNKAIGPAFHKPLHQPPVSPTKVEHSHLALSRPKWEQRHNNLITPSDIRRTIELWFHLSACDATQKSIFRINISDCGSR